jgi:hypothetical protein
MIAVTNALKQEMLNRLELAGRDRVKIRVALYGVLAWLRREGWGTRLDPEESLFLAGSVTEAAELVRSAAVLREEYEWAREVRGFVADVQRNIRIYKTI